MDWSRAIGFAAGMNVMMSLVQLSGGLKNEYLSGAPTILWWIVLVMSGLWLTTIFIPR